MSEKEKSEPKFYGSASVGSKGQIVIPSDLREDIGIDPGDKLLFLTKSDEESGFGVVKPRALLEMEEKLNELKKKIEEE